MAAPSEEKLICDQFNLEALTVNQLKVSKVGSIYGRSSIKTSSLAKGYDSGPPSLHPWEI
jgi:hypothetical protein